MQIEGGFSHAAKLHQANFGVAPEALDAVDMVAADGEFVLAMLDSIVLLLTQIDDAIVGPKAVGMDG